MSSADKAVVERRQGGAVVSASNSSVRKRPPKTALDEDEFTDVSNTYYTTQVNLSLLAVYVH